MHCRQAAESKASQLHASTCPGTAATPTANPPSTPSTPAFRLLTAVLSRLAETELLLADETAAHAGSDRAARRLPVPLAPGGRPPPEALLQLLDVTSDEDGGWQQGGHQELRLVPPADKLAWEDRALLHATSAAAPAAGTGPAGVRVRARALVSVGKALLFKANSSSSSPLQGVNSAPAAAELFRQQAVDILKAAAAAAQGADDLQTVRQAALTLAHAQLRAGAPAEAAEWVAVAQSAAASEGLRAAFLTAASPSEHPEVLAWRQLEAAASAGGGGAGASGLVHHAAAVVAAAGATHARLQLGALPLLAPTVGMLPAAMRVLMFHFDESAEELFLVAANLPGQQQNTSPGAPTTDPAATTTTNSGGSSTVVASMHATEQDIRSLVSAFKSYRRQLGKQLLDVTTAVRQQAAYVAAAAAREVAAQTACATAPQQPQQHEAARKLEPSGTVSRQGDKKAATAAAAAAAAAAVAAAHARCVPDVPLLDQDVNEAWEKLVGRFEAFLSPLAETLQAALPPLAAAAPAAPATATYQGGGRASVAAAAAAAKAAVAAAAAASSAAQGTAEAACWPPGGHSVLLLLDADLGALPWEALPLVRSTCGGAGRCFSAALARHLLAPPAPATAGATTAAAPPPQAQPPVAVDVSRLTYIADPLHEESDALPPAATAGSYTVPILPLLRDKLLPAFGAGWSAGVVGVPGGRGCVPSEGEYAAALAGAAGLLFLGLGRFLAYAPPAVSRLLLL
jgi:hypothetical protein